MANNQLDTSTLENWLWDAVVLLEEVEQERIKVDKELQNVLKELDF